MRHPSLPCLLLAAALLPASAAADSGELHGTVQTSDGRRLEGVLRWDRNENSWDDALDATKETETVIEADEENSFRFLGLRFPSWGDESHRVLHQFSVPFGHVESLRRQEDGWATVHLKGGRTFRVRATGDLGPGMRGLRVTGPGGEIVDLEWHDLSRIDFTPADESGDAMAGSRLYGTVATRTRSLTGYVVWDRDESLLTDILDGRQAGTDHEIPFSDIRFLAREGYRSCRVGLVDGSEIELSGINDVNDGNRDIIVTVPGLGTVAVAWDEFVRLDLAPAPPSAPYGSFDGGHRLRGRMITADGQSHEGDVTWDLDEQYSWETLDGQAFGLRYAIPFAHIAAIENSGRRGALVRLRDGTTLELRDGNDVDEDNKGVVIEGPGDRRVQVDWDGFQALELDSPAEQ